MGISIWKDKIYMLETKNSMYVMQEDSEGLLRHLYWGKKAGTAEDFEDVSEEENATQYYQHVETTREEYSPFGGMRYKESACKLEYSDGTNDFRYQIACHEIDGNKLSISLVDIDYPCRIVLHYEVFEEEDIIRRQVEIKNEGTEPIVVERLYSAQFGLSGTDYKSINFNGTWNAEFQRQDDTILGGKKVYESLKGSTAHVANPCFILHRDAKEEQGEVYFGALAYSGNFKTVIEATPYGWTNVLLGISDTDFSWQLKPGETLTTPEVYAGYSAEGFGGMSDRMHRLEHAHLMPEEFAKKTHRVLYNSWYATEFNVQCSEQMKLAEKAAKLGTELFVIDDGWFGDRTDDTKALGDWWVDKRKFPNGLGELIDHVKSLGMEFGVWVEPEMTNPDSDLYRKHPDWVYRFHNREILTGRNQYVLDLTREEVVTYLIDILDKLLAENDISYIKWDLNRYISENGVNGAISLERKKMWFLHVQNFYRIVREVRRRHPNVEFEACAGGGGRVDLGAMKLFDEYWTSDNTDPLDRLFIQENYSLLYPAKYMRAWVTDAPTGETARRVPMQFAFYAAMCGCLGVGYNLNKMAEEDLEKAAYFVNLYKQIRDIVQFGRLHRLNSLSKDEIQAVLYVKEGKGVAFVFLPQVRYEKNSYRIRLAGLKEDVCYRVCFEGKEVKKSGAFLMRHGLDVRLYGNYDSCMIQLEECQEI